MACVTDEYQNFKAFKEDIDTRSTFLAQLSAQQQSDLDELQTSMVSIQDCLSETTNTFNNYKDSHDIETEKFEDLQKKVTEAESQAKCANDRIDAIVGKDNWACKADLGKTGAWESGVSERLIDFLSAHHTGTTVAA